MDTKVHPNGHSTRTIDLHAKDEGSKSRPHPYQVVAGALLSITGIGIILSIITNEALYPAERNYDTFTNTISDLGGTIPPNSYMVEPNRLIFIVTMAIGGAFVLTATALLWRSLARRGFLIALGALGIGLIGIAIFPGNVANWHPLLALLCFVGGSIAAILSGRFLDRPLRYFAIVLGAVALVSTVLGLEALEGHWPQTMIGLGGVERWIAYPVLLWMVLVGSVFMTKQIDANKSGA
jgi:hypothetical membrane protein